MTTPLVGLSAGKAYQGRSSARIPANAPSGAICLFRHSLRGSGLGAFSLGSYETPLPNWPNGLH
jgi:hypothetical protein